MGQAKRRREEIAGYAPGRCNGCNLCCVVFTIPEIEKKAFTPCANLCAAGCSIHNLPTKPKTCIEFECDYIVAHRTNHRNKDVIPHPKDAGAYISHPGTPNVVLMSVDPKHPSKWQSSSMPTYLRALSRAGFKVVVMDRGYHFEADTVAEIDAMLSVDLVQQAIARGEQPRYLSPVA
jgi:hypothetical protein